MNRGRNLAAGAALAGLVFVALTLAGCGGEGGTRTGVPEDARPLAADQVAVNGSSYVSPLGEVFGDVYVGERTYVGPNTVLRAAPGLRVGVGDGTNVQDNAIVRARDGASTIGDRTSLAHHTIVRDSEVGDFVFLGMASEVVNATIGDGAFVQHGAYVEDVTVPEGTLVSVGETVTTQAEADALPRADASTEEYRRSLLEVTGELAEGYLAMFEDGNGYERVLDVGPNPETSYGGEPATPQLGDSVVLEEFARIVGDVRIGAGSRIAQRCTLRADEGTPIVLGVNAEVDDRVSFHALRGTDLRVGDDFDDAVVHGPLEVDDGVSIEDRAVVFRAVVGDDVKIGEDALIIGPEPDEDGGLALRIPDGTVIPEGAIVASQESVPG